MICYALVTWKQKSCIWDRITSAYRMTTVVLSLLALAIFALSADATAKRDKDLTFQKAVTVDELDIESYEGNWYQMYADKFVYQTFEKNLYCGTATYKDQGAGNLTVHNYQTLGSPTGAADTIDGYAYQEDPNEPGKLEVYFPNPDQRSRPKPAPYYILQLGPKNSDGKYEWSIVSDKISFALFVLARDVDTFWDKYDVEVQGILKDLGFSGYTAPVATYQGDDCVYEIQN